MSDPVGFVDYYSQCEQALTDFFKAGLPDVFVKDYQITDNENDMLLGQDYFILFRPGAIPERPVTFQSAEHTYLQWRVTVNLFTRYVYKQTQWAQFKRFRALILYILETKQFLPNNANVEKIVSYSAPEDALYWKFKNTSEDADPNMMTQALSIVLTQRIAHDG
ncbi:MAG: hypothetical protein KPEEDBHJ_03593 [Anaerolineales bacterium]|nr:hypothetical protein [Anaerolineales bacterium]